MMYRCLFRSLFGAFVLSAAAYGSAACRGDDGQENGSSTPDGDADSDSDADTDVDSDTDADADADTDADGDVSSGISGTVTYNRRPISQSGLGTPQATALGHAAVTLEGGGGEIARGETAADGTFYFEIPSPQVGEVLLRVLASGPDNNSGARVADFGGATYSVSTEPFAPEPGTSLSIAVDSSANSGAFAIFDTLSQGIIVAEAGLGEAMPQAVAHWERGRQTPGGTSYLDGWELWILGGPEDTDEYDTSVLMHELGHFVQAVTASTSLVAGNPHAGQSTDPRLAWSEGWASFFSCMALGQSQYMDSVGEQVWYVVDLWALPEGGEYMARPSAGMEQTLSEWLVAGTLWHILTEEPDQPSAQLMSLDVITQWFQRVPAPDRGAQGFDMVDYLDGYLCIHDFSAQGPINSFLDRRGFPYDGAPDCHGKPFRPLREDPLPLLPDGLFRGHLIESVDGRALRDVPVTAIFDDRGGL